MRKGRVALMWLMTASFMVIMTGTATARADSKDDFLAAREALRQGNLQEVAVRADALGKDPLGIYPRYWLLSAQIDLITPEHIQPFLKFYQGSWLAEKLRGDWLRALGKRGEWALFREQYPQLSDEPAPDLLCYSFQARIDSKDKTALPQARAALWFTAKDLPTAACDPVIQQLLASGTVTDTDIRDRLRLAFEVNVQGLARYLADRLGVELKAKDLEKLVSDPAAWLKKPVGGGKLQPELAIFAVARLARSDVDAAVAQLQQWQERLDDNQKLYGWRRLAVAAAFRQDPRALAWFRKSEALPWDDVAVEWQLRQALRGQDWDAVQTGLRFLSDNKQKERGWQYWKARALEAKALEAKTTPAAATKIYAQLSVDDDYYGLLARDRLGPVMGAARPVYKLIDEDWRRVEANAGLQRALRLNEMELRTEATREWNWALRGADDRLLLTAAETASIAGWYDRAIYAAERTKTLHNYELRYLAPYRDITRDYAEQTGLDEAWVFGLMRQESRFVAVARSGVGAGGLMQLMPATARWVAGKVGLKYEPSMVNDAGTNVRLGTWYLKHVLDVLSSQPVLATAAYNAGPNRARNWQPEASEMEAAIYIESIPFSETRDYVKKVMANAVHYAQAFGQPRQTLTARIGTIPPRNPQVIEGP